MKQGRERGKQRLRVGLRDEGLTEAGLMSVLSKGSKWECHSLNAHHGIFIKQLLLFESKLQRTVNYTWKIFWARPLADGKAMVANEISRLPHGKKFCALPP